MELICYACGNPASPHPYRHPVALTPTSKFASPKVVAAARIADVLDRALAEAERGRRTAGNANDCLGSKLRNVQSYSDELLARAEKAERALDQAEEAYTRARIECEENIADRYKAERERDEADARVVRLQCEKLGSDCICAPDETGHTRHNAWCISRAKFETIRELRAEVVHLEKLMSDYVKAVSTAGEAT